MRSVWAIFKNITFKGKTAVSTFWPTFGKLVVLFIPTSGHTAGTAIVKHLLSLPSLAHYNQRDGIYRESILEHFLPKSKQTPKPSAYIEC